MSEPGVRFSPHPARAPNGKFSLESALLPLDLDPVNTGPVPRQTLVRLHGVQSPSCSVPAIRDSLSFFSCRGLGKSASFRVGNNPYPPHYRGIRFLPISVSPLAVAFRRDFPEFLHVDDNMAFRCPLCPGRSLLGRACDHSAHAPCAVAILVGLPTTTPLGSLLITRL
ncbi:MAG: hypothetical protein ACTSXP_16110 [Promethearchaeota archaeon]